MTIGKATFSAGCFWDAEAAFRRVAGVLATRVGYMEAASPIEVCEVLFDTDRLAFGDLLEIFWRCHDPAAPGRGRDECEGRTGSVIFWHHPEQARLAAASRDRRPGPVITEILPAGTFQPAGEAHQQHHDTRGIPPRSHPGR